MCRRRCCAQLGVPRDILGTMEAGACERPRLFSMYAIVTDHAHDLVLCLILPEKRSTPAAKARTTRELAKLGYKPSDTPIAGDRWTYSQVSPHWVLRRKPFRQFVKDNVYYSVVLVEDFHSDKIDHLIKDDNQVIIACGGNK